MVLPTTLPSSLVLGTRLSEAVGAATGFLDSPLSRSLPRRTDQAENSAPLIAGGHLCLNPDSPAQQLRGLSEPHCPELSDNNTNHSAP